MANNKLKLATKKQKYSEDSLISAIADVKTHKLGIREAAKKYGVPVTTVYNNLKKEKIKKIGHPTVLTSKEEEELVSIIKISSDWAYPMEASDIKTLVQSYLNANNKKIKEFNENLPGYYWYRGFIKRYKNSLTVRKPQNVKRNRAKITSNDINEYFDELAKVVDGLKPENILNYDETNMTDDPGSSKIICRRSTKRAEKIIDSSKTSVSVMFTGSAAGKLLPPYIVYKSKKFYNTWLENGPEGAVYNQNLSR